MATSKQGGAKGAQSAPPKSKRMSQSAVLNHFAERFGLRRAQVKEIFDELAELAAKEVKRNEEFALPGFGKLVLAKRKAREGRNPQTGAPIKIKARRVVRFTAGKTLKNTVK